MSPDQAICELATDLPADPPGSSCSASQENHHHTVVLARVVETDHEDLAAPLTYHRRVFGTYAALHFVSGRTA